MKWGKDMEERAAVTQKAHDAYAVARATMAKAEGAIAAVEILRLELSDTHRAIAKLTTENARIASDLMAARRDIAALQQQFAEATEPVEAPAPQAAPRKRKAS